MGHLVPRSAIDNRVRHAVRRAHVYDASHGRLRANDALQRHPRAHGADAAGAVGLVLRHVRGRLALRDRRDRRHRPFRRAHVLQGHRAAPDRARHLGRDRRDRRRVQRVHRQGVHGLLRQVRRRHARRRARRPRRHAPQLTIRPRGDRPREGRHRRGDEHVLRHAARLHRRRLREPPLRRPAARPRHHRHEGDRPRRDAARRSRRSSTAGTGPSAWSSASAARIGDGLDERLEELLGSIEPRETGLPEPVRDRRRTARP